MRTVGQRRIDQRRETSRVAEVVDRLCTHPYGLHSLAACRILLGTMYVGVLLSNLRDRRLLWGPGSSWMTPLRDGYGFDGWLVGLQHLPGGWFDLFYLAVLAAAVCFTLGRLTRTAGVLLLLGSIQLVESAPMLGDQGDNIARIGLFYLLWTRCSVVWSWDARLRWGGMDSTLQYLVWTRLGLERVLDRDAARAVGTFVSNVALGLLMAQIVMVYVTAGLFKARGGPWQFGTALYYPLSLPEFRPFGFLNDLLVAQPVLLALATWSVVLLQVLFPLTLPWAPARRVALVGIASMHLGIALLMGLPWFSLSMLAFDTLFVSERALLRVQAFAVDRWDDLVIAVQSRVRRTA